MKNRLLITLFTSLIGFTSFAETTTEYCAPVQQAFPYYTIGTGPILLLPNVGIGYRSRYDRLGLDGSLSFSTAGYVHQFQGNIVGHLYLDRYLVNSRYIGLGMACSGLVTNHKKGGGYFAPDFVYGKQFGKKKRQFLEFHLQIPNIIIAKKMDVTPFPGMYIKYGTAF